MLIFSQYLPLKSELRVDSNPVGKGKIRVDSNPGLNGLNQVTNAITTIIINGINYNA